MANLEKIVEDLSSLTVLEAAELPKLLEEKGGVCVRGSSDPAGREVAGAWSHLRAGSAGAQRGADRGDALVARPGEGHALGDRPVPAVPDAVGRALPRGPAAVRFSRRRHQDGRSEE